MKKQYKVLSASTPETLEAIVNEHLEAGAELVGGVAVSSRYESWENERKGYTESNTEYTYAQAVLLTGI